MFFQEKFRCICYIFTKFSFLVCFAGNWFFSTFFPGKTKSSFNSRDSSSLLLLLLSSFLMQRKLTISNFEESSIHDEQIQLMQFLCWPRPKISKVTGRIASLQWSSLYKFSIFFKKNINTFSVTFMLYLFCFMKKKYIHY